MNAAETIDAIIRQRRTRKVLSDRPLPERTDRSVIEDLIATASWAPFHHPAPQRSRSRNAAELERNPTPQSSGELHSNLNDLARGPEPSERARDGTATPLDSIVPWRFYLLDAAACRALRKEILEQGIANKLPAMLAAADALIQATWIPKPSKSPNEQLFEPTMENMEHIAAASAAAQNLLLAATARGIPSYWSSGGNLRSPEMLRRLKIPANEILIGSLFLFPRDLSELDVKPGKLRDQRGPAHTWSRWVEL